MGMRMTPERAREVHDILRKSAFGYGRAQDYISFHRFLAEKEISFEEIIELVEVSKLMVAKKVAQRARLNLSLREKKDYFPKCPKCGEIMRLSPGDDDDSHWTCTRCRFGIYEPRPFHEIIDEITRKKKKVMEDKENGTR